MFLQPPEDSRECLRFALSQDIKLKCFYFLFFYLKSGFSKAGAKLIDDLIGLREQKSSSTP